MVKKKAKSKKKKVSAEIPSILVSKTPRAPLTARQKELLSRAQQRMLNEIDPDIIENPSSVIVPKTPRLKKPVQGTRHFKGTRKGYVEQPVVAGDLIQNLEKVRDLVVSILADLNSGRKVDLKDFVPTSVVVSQK